MFEAKHDKEYDFYIAAPLFSDAERTYNRALYDILYNAGFYNFLPQLTEAGSPNQIFRKNMDALENSRDVIAICDGADMDSGTAWECGRFSGTGHIYVLRTDFRKSADDPSIGVNLMIGQSADRIFTNRHEMIGWIRSNYLRR